MSKKKPLTPGELRTLRSLMSRAEDNCQIGVNPVTIPADAIKAVLNQRGERYGDFTDHARLAQDLQDVLRGDCTSIGGSGPYTFAHNHQAQLGWNRLSAVQKQALTVICDKLARIISGDPNYDDNWIDIQGYARLAQERLLQSDTSPE